MRKIVSLMSTAALLSLAVAAPAQQQVRQAPEAPPNLQLDTAFEEAAKAGTRTYVIQMRRESGLEYEGGIAGFAATAPVDGQKYDANASHVQMYTADLVRTHDELLSTLGAGSAKIYSYRHAMNGFAATLTDEQAATLRGNKNVAAVWEDYAVEITTNNSPEFVGLLDKKGGLRRDLGLEGEDIIVGILDTGAVPQHPSFSDVEQKKSKGKSKGKSKVVYDAPPERWNGICQVGEGWTEDDCNNKLIGARWFADGFLAGPGVVEGEFLSPRDTSGHGSHTAGTAAGNEVEATLQGVPVTTISGMAPRARVAVYKVCWLAPGASNFSCFFSDSAAATDAAVADGVDVLNFSVGTAAAFNDPQDLAFLDATAAGVFVARSGGNSGPGFGTTPAGEPWVTTVAASTHSGIAFAGATTINAPAELAGDYASLEGAITKPLVDSGAIIDDLVPADPIEACTPVSNDFAGKIALIARGACAFTDKIENAVAAGASGVIVYTQAGNPKVTMGGTATEATLSIPGVMIDNDIGVALVDAITGGAAANATISPGIFVEEEIQGDIMATFSSRGPYLTQADWVKPDITAPGVRILAASSPDQADGSAGDLFAYLQGTSMSGPHIAGLGALIKEAHPDWSPAQIKSALMTTARQNLVKEDGVTPTDPFDYGAGHVDPNFAVDPGLTYDAGLLDYLVASCGTATPLISAGDCAFVEDILGLSTDASDLNLPSIGIDGIPGTQTVTRTVTAVSGYDGKKSKGSKKSKGKGSTNNDPVLWVAEVEAPEGFDVTVEPSSIYLAPGESASYDVTISNASAPAGEWRFGSLTWVEQSGKKSKGSKKSKGKGSTSAVRRVRSPIAVNATAVIAPDELSSAGPAGAGSFDITFGYDGEYSAGVHGLNDNGLNVAVVEDDPGNSFEFFGPGTEIAFLAEVPEGTAYARWELTNEYTNGNDDIDLYLYYCPNLLCTQIDSSTNADSNEQVNAFLPANDPTIDDPYLVFVHGFDTEGGVPTTLLLFSYDFSAVPGSDNLSAMGPTSATIGATETISIEWMDLPFGVGFAQLGGISHSDAEGIQALTLLSIDNDTGRGVCEFEFLNDIIEGANIAPCPE